MIVDAEGADERHIGGVGDEFEPVSQHELGREADAQRVELNVVREQEFGRRAGGGAGIVARDLRAAVSQHLFAEEIIADKGAELGAGRFQERIAGVRGQIG